MNKLQLTYCLLSKISENITTIATKLNEDDSSYGVLFIPVNTNILNPMSQAKPIVRCCVNTFYLYQQTWNIKLKQGR